MVAPNTPAPAILDDKLVFRVAKRRAQAFSWDAIAAEVHWHPLDLEFALTREPAFEKAIARAKNARDDEAEAELVHQLRAQMRDDDKKVAFKAAQELNKHLSNKRRDRTRLEVEKLRAETKIATAQARGVKSSDDGGVDVIEETPERRAELEQQFWSSQARHAAESSARNSEVYVWGGAHKIGSTPPDATDTRVAIVSDTTNAPRHIYWIMRYPPPTDAMNGPFPAPAKRIPEVHDHDNAPPMNNDPPMNKE